MGSSGELNPLLHEREKFPGLASTKWDVHGKKSYLISVAVGLPFRAHIDRHHEAQFASLYFYIVELCITPKGQAENGEDNFIIKDEKGHTANLTISNVYQSNGVIQVVDTVLLPN